MLVKIYTVGRIIFKDKRFRGFRGYLLKLEIKYPCNFVYTRVSLDFLFNMYTWWVNASFMEVLQTRREVKTSLPSPSAGSLCRATFSCMAATKEIQRVIARNH